MTKIEWEIEGKKRFGDKMLDWKFKCPACGHIASVKDYKNAGAETGVVAFSCIGRYLKTEPRRAFGEDGKGPCDYAGGGLIGLNPVEVEGIHYFEFADV
jgi:hypothetical protein